MATIYRPSAAVMNPISRGRPRSACKEVPYGLIPNWGQLIMERFLTNTEFVYYQGATNVSMSSPLWVGEKAGAWWIKDGTVPPFKVDAGFVRPKQRSSLTAKQFELMKRNGKIVVGKRSVGSVTVKDQPVIKSGTRYPADWRNPIVSPLLTPFIEQTWDACSNTVSPSLPLGDLRYFFGNMYDPGVVGSYSMMGTYECYTNATLSTLLTEFRPSVANAIRDITNAYSSIEPTAGLVTGASAELNDAIFDITTELAELPDTVAMIMAAIKKALLYYKETRRKVTLAKRKTQNPADLIDEIAELWLQYRYGIQPIVYTVQDALAYLEKSGILYRTVRRGTNHLVPISSPGWSFTSPLEIRERCWAKGRFSASTTNGLGFNPIVTAWELVPLSFVVDWFLNIGDLLSALVPSSSYDERVFTQSTQCKQTVFGRHFSGHTVPFVVDLYDLKPINPIDHYGLSFDPLLSIKQKLDALSLTWLLFLKDFRR